MSSVVLHQNGGTSIQHVPRSWDHHPARTRRDQGDLFPYTPFHPQGEMPMTPHVSFWLWAGASGGDSAEDNDQEDIIIIIDIVTILIIIVVPAVMCILTTTTV